VVENGSFRSIFDGSEVMKILQITGATAYTVNGNRVWQQFSDTKHGFFHRLVVNGIPADWTAWDCIALFQLGRRTLPATTDYYVDALPSVFEIIGGRKNVQEN